MITSRFNPSLSFYLINCFVCSFLISLFLVQLFGALLSFMWLFEKFSEKRKAIDKLAVLILLYGIVRLLSIVFSDFPRESVQSIYKEALFYFVFFSMSFYMKVLDKDKLLKIVYSFAAASVLVSVIGIIKFNLDLDYRASSFSSGYMTFSAYLLATLGMLSFGITLHNIHLNWLVRSLGISFIMTGIITSLGRVNIAIALFVLIFASIMKRIRIKEFAAVILLTSALSAVSFYNNSFRIFEYRVSNPSQLSDRDIILKGAWDLFRCFENPVLGYGPRSFNSIFPYYIELSDKRINSWHNDFIQLYFESGIMGFIVFCILVFVPIFIGMRYLLNKNFSDRSKEDLIWGVVVSTAALTAAALSSVFLNSPVLSVIFAFILSVESAVLYREPAGNRIFKFKTGA